MVAFALALERAVAQPEFRRLATLAIVTAAGLMTHYFFAFTIAAGVLWLAVEGRARTRVPLALAAGVALCAPWTPFFLRQYHADRYSWIGPFSASQVLATPTHLVGPLLETPLVVVWLVLATGLAWRTGPRARLVTLLALAPIGIASMVWASGMRIYAARNLIGATPFLAILLVVPLAHLHGRLRVTAATLVAGVLVAGYAASQLRPDVPYRAIAQALIADGWHGADPIAVAGGLHALRSPLEWYLPDAPRFVHRLRLQHRTELVYVVLGSRSGGRAAARDRIRIGNFLVGLLPAHDIRQRGPGRLTLFAPRPRPAPTYALARHAASFCDSSAPPGCDPGPRKPAGPSFGL